MKSIHNLLICVLCSILSAAALADASSRLVIHATEFGVGKFHRYDNSVHAYGANNAWSAFILPSGISSDKAYIQKNIDNSFTVFFSTLEELISSIVQISKQENKQVSVLNLHGHGLPGRMWFPQNAQTMDSFLCSDWKNAASGDDVNNYNQYYSALSYDEIMQIRSMSNNPNVDFGCTTGLKEWQTSVSQSADFLKSLAQDLQIHFLSCVVGLGSLGEEFTKGLAQLLIPSGNGRVEASMDFGLGDWSMPNGMGFWDYQNQSQLDHDNSVYPVHHQDSEIAQKGTIRLASFKNGAWQSSLIGNQDFLQLIFEAALPTGPVFFELQKTKTSLPAAHQIRVPGTNSYVQVLEK